VEYTKYKKLKHLGRVSLEKIEGNIYGVSKVTDADSGEELTPITELLAKDHVEFLITKAERSIELSTEAIKSYNLLLNDMHKVK